MGFKFPEFVLVDSESVSQTLRDGVADPFVTLRKEYGDLQGVLPQDGKIALAVEHPFLFDFSRSKLLPLDVIGAASPKHGFRTELSPKDLDHYFQSQGIRYLVFEDPNKASCQYSRKFWSTFQNDPVNKDFHKYWYPHHLQFFDYLDWKRVHSLVASHGRYHVVKVED